MGGNAFDAAVAITGALAVVEPTGSGLGGGGFWLLHRESDGFQTMIDGRERAPLAATADMYLDEEGNIVRGLSRDGPLAAGVPGEPAAMVYLASTYGTLPMTTLLAPAIRYAEEGVALTHSLRRSLERRRQSLNAEAAEIFLVGGKMPEVGDLIRQEDLARTLRRIAEKGHDGFYAGETSRLLVEASERDGGIWSQEDFDQYRVVERDPIVFSYRDARIVSAPPPSSGGVVLAQMMQILEALPTEEAAAGLYHQLIEAMRQAYQDRALYLGDSDFVDIDIARLTSKSYAQEKAATITAVASPSVPFEELASEGQDTTHFSVIDGEGNRVAGTLSINFSLGAGYIAAGTGVWFNNEMDDFSAKPAVGNGYGLVGGFANSIQPGKRPLSSMTPTFIEYGDRVVALGTPGGSRIITMVLLATLGILDGETGLQEAVDQPRFHHQYLPDEVHYETGAFSQEENDDLVSRGHRLRLFERGYGNMHAVSRHAGTGHMEAASDGRGEGEAAVLSGSAETSL
jgi:gamma-glutamyltranspeptidase/glutathione hydrolase